jgi:large subunit ribosomal protein L30
MDKQIRITQIKSANGRPPKHRRTLRALGLTKMHQTVEKADTDAIRGMINQISHLVKVED